MTSIIALSWEVRSFFLCDITRKWNNFAIVLIVFVHVVFVLVLNKNVENRLPIFNYKRGLLLFIWHLRLDTILMIIIHVELHLKSQSFFKGSEFSRSEVSRPEFSKSEFSRQPRRVFWVMPSTAYPVLQTRKGNWRSPSYYRIKGLNIPTLNTGDPAKLEQYLTNFQTKSDDVFVASYLKSGKW